MALNEFYKVNLDQSQRGQLITNEFWYQQQSASGNALDLASQFVDVLLDLIKLIQSSTVLYRALRVYSHSDPLNFVETDLTGQTGGAAANSLPTYVAVAFRQPRLRSDMRQGAKRFAGCPDANDTVGTITNTGYLTAMDNLAAAMSDPLDDPAGTGSYQMVIVRRVKVTVDGKTYYRVPDVISSTDFYPAISWSKVTETTSQNSRKIGKGS